MQNDPAFPSQPNYQVLREFMALVKKRLFVIIISKKDSLKRKPLDKQRSAAFWSLNSPL